jgi:hypothetical protein
VIPFAVIALVTFKVEVDKAPFIVPEDDVIPFVVIEFAMFNVGAVNPPVNVPPVSFKYFASFCVSLVATKSLALKTVFN